MANEAARRTRWKIKRIANEMAELPGLRWLARPAYHALYRRGRVQSNAYLGVFDDYQQASAAAPAVLPSTYDFNGAGCMYRDQHSRIRVSDYPLLFWLGRLLDAGERRLFDLGGHIGVTYYGFERYLDYPTDMSWLVHDVPAVVADGRAWAERHDPRRALSFTGERADADGRDVLLTSGALQYLDYALPEFLATLEAPPRHVLVNLVPMHPRRGYFTLQHIGVAILPYRVSSIPDFVSAMEALGYVKVDDWATRERNLRVPFEPGHEVDAYSGFYFRRGNAGP